MAVLGSFRPFDNSEGNTIGTIILPVGVSSRGGFEKAVHLVGKGSNPIRPGSGKTGGELQGCVEVIPAIVGGMVVVVELSLEEGGSMGELCLEEVISPVLVGLGANSFDGGVVHWNFS
jgi:hypothetical protein